MSGFKKSLEHIWSENAHFFEKDMIGGVSNISKRYGKPTISM